MPTGGRKKCTCVLPPDFPQPITNHCPKGMIQPCLLYLCNGKVNTRSSIEFQRKSETKDTIQNRQEGLLLKKILKSPAGIAGIIVLAFGLLIGSNYDPKSYKQQDTYGITDPYQAAKVMAQNKQKAQDQQTELLMIWGSIGFGLLMLGSATWKASTTGTGEGKTD